MILDNAFHPDVRVFKEASFFIERGHHVDILCYDGRGAFLDKKEDNINGIHEKDIISEQRLAHFSLIKYLLNFIIFFMFCGYLNFSLLVESM